MTRTVKIGNHEIGPGKPVYIIAEIGINHNGDIEIAKQLIDTASLAGCDAVKFQKRTPELCVPKDQRDIERETPWGRMTYLKYRYRVEFDAAQYRDLDQHCRKKGIQWTASCWDEGAVDFIEQFDPPFHKVPSASLTDQKLLALLNSTGRPIVLSTGMSTMDQIREAVRILNKDRLIITHSTSTYPCPPEELNLKMIPTLQSEFLCPVGYSGHEVGLAATVAAAALGACLVERHITLNRAMWGSDQAASVEPQGLMSLVKNIRAVEKALGTGTKVVYDSERPILARLRRV